MGQLPKFNTENEDHRICDILSPGDEKSPSGRFIHKIRGFECGNPNPIQMYLIITFELLLKLPQNKRLINNCIINNSNPWDITFRTT